MNITSYAELHYLLKEDPVKAAYYIRDNIFTERGKLDFIEPENEADAIILAAGILKKLLEIRAFEKAATLLWGPLLFSAEAFSVKVMWESLENQCETLVIGAGSMGKSYSVAIWIVLDWLCDPTMTCVKVLSSTEAHAKRNVFAHIKNFFYSSVLPLPGRVKDTFIMCGSDDKQGIHLMTVPPGEEGKGRIRGFHPVPRNKPHPIYGLLSRIRVVVDEAEEVPSNIWEETDNILSTKQDEQGIKLISMTNPKNRGSVYGQRCKPMMGWSSINIDSSIQWQTETEARVVRIDAAMCENVIQRRVVFPGLQTYDGYMRFAADPHSADYYTMARGWFPETTLAASLISIKLVENLIGKLKFVATPVNLLAIDLAISSKKGTDSIIATPGRFGLCDGYDSVKFKEITGCLEVLEQFKIGKADPTGKTSNTTWIVRQIIELARQLNVTPGQLIVDRTGAGAGIHDILMTEFGSDVVGINFSGACTKMKLLEEDTKLPEEIYSRINSEMMFAVKYWLEYNRVKVGPKIENLDELTEQLTNRKYRTVSSKITLESKDEYITRTQNPSPDKADSFMMLVHLARLFSGDPVRASSLPKTFEDEPKPEPAIVGAMRYLKDQPIQSYTPKNDNNVGRSESDYLTN